MTPLFPARRAAEEFDSALAGRASSDVAERHAELLATVATLRAMPEVAPRAEFVEDLRSRLMLAAETDLVAAPPVVRRAPTTHTTPRTRRRAGTVAAALVIVGGTAGMAAAASGSLPGQPLYPLKRGGEQVGEIVRLTDAGRGTALLGQAENRLDEVGDLMATGTADESLVSGTLDAFRAAADEGSHKLFVSFQRDGDQSDVTAVRSFAASQMATINTLAATSDARQAALLLDAADTLADIDQQALQLCGDCGSGSALVTPAALSEGAAAASVDNLLARPVAQAQADVTAARLAGLLAQAQKKADSTPKLDLSAPTGAAGTAAQAGEPVTSTISGSGQLLPGVKASPKAVDDLVTGVTGTVAGVSGGVAGVGESLGETLDSTTGGATGGLTDTVDGVTQNLKP